MKVIERKSEYNGVLLSDISQSSIGCVNQVIILRNLFFTS